MACQRSSPGCCDARVQEEFYCIASDVAGHSKVWIHLAHWENFATVVPGLVDLCRFDANAT